MSVIAPDVSMDFLPLFPNDDEATVLGRLVDWANEGLDPVVDAEQWVDTREGSHWHTCIFPAVREIARLYDLAGTDVPMSGFVLWAWESYLDDLAAIYEVTRKPATPALVTLTFSNSGGADQMIDAGTTVSSVPSTPDDPAPDFEVTTGGTVPAGGTVDLPAQASDAGTLGNVAAHAITAPSTPLPAGVTVDNAEPSSDGTDVEADDPLRQRVLEAITGKGPGTVADYVRWATEWPGVGGAKVVPVFAGASTVLVMATDPAGRPLPSTVIDALQADLDPVAGKGEGTAPIGAHVTVDTSTLLNIDITGTLTFEEGYSWAGTGGTVAVGPDIQKAITAYLASVPPGGEVVAAHVKGILATWPGVHDITAFAINTGTANVAVGLTPPKVAVLNTITIS